MSTSPQAPDYGHGYLRVPLSVWAALYCRAPLTRRQLQLVSVVLRESWGWQARGGGVHLWTRPLTTGHFARATGLATDHLARDLRTLVARGVLREKNGCYQLNASKSRGPVDNAGDKSGAGKAAAAESAEPAAETAAKTARTALSPPGVKKAKIRNKNVSGATGRELSPGGDNSAVLNRALAEELVGIIRLFAGSLPSRLEAPLRDWIREAGVAAVWTTLEPHLRSGPEQTRSKLEAVLNGTGRYR